MAEWFWEDLAATTGRVCRDSISYVVQSSKIKVEKISFFIVFLVSPPLGQVISAAKKDIIKAYYPGYFMQAVKGQVQTRQIQASHDDSYQGKLSSISFGLILISAVKVHPDVCLVCFPGYSVAVGEFSGDQVEGTSS